ncbi:DUF3768 domain-containing protein [Phenylobacterium sp.]|uniref:DUF3768 domain-containing protein n=1 Tax=Phenylobacterium sp. TaxID=1871053 RepID=UPI003565FF80
MSQSDQDRDHRAATIAHLNDKLRLNPGTGWVMTSGVHAKGVAFVAHAIAAVGAFNDFTDGDDLYGERDFGALRLAGERLFWKIDYYDQALENGSPDPADEALTRRVLTLMLASEY